MTYFDGFVIAVPTANKEDFVRHAAEIDPMFVEMGAVRVHECWGDDVPDGKVTDYRRAVKAEAGEAVVYSFIQWPDKATRDQAWKTMMDDPDMSASDMPFDGKRMFWGGFKPIVELDAG